MQKGKNIQPQEVEGSITAWQNSDFKDLHQFAKETSTVSLNTLCFILGKKWKSSGRTLCLLEFFPWRSNKNT